MLRLQPEDFAVEIAEVEADGLIVREELLHDAESLIAATS